MNIYSDREQEVLYTTLTIRKAAQHAYHDHRELMVSGGGDDALRRVAPNRKVMGIS